MGFDEKQQTVFGHRAQVTIPLEGETINGFISDGHVVLARGVMAAIPLKNITPSSQLWNLVERLTMRPVTPNG